MKFSQRDFNARRPVLQEMNNKTTANSNENNKPKVDIMSDRTEGKNLKEYSRKTIPLKEKKTVLEVGKPYGKESTTKSDTFLSTRIADVVAISNQLCLIIEDYKSDSFSNFRKIIQKYHAVDFIKLRNGDNESLLFVASKYGRFEVVRFLIIVKKLDSSFQNKDGLSCLHIACYNGHYSTVEFLILIAEANTNITDNNGDTALHLAVWKGHVDIVKMLCGLSTMQTNRTNNDGSTPLHLACIFGNMSIIKYLIEEAQVELEVPNKDGLTPLQLAYQSDNIQFISEIKEIFHKRGYVDVVVEESPESTHSNTGHSENVEDRYEMMRGTPSTPDYNNTQSNQDYNNNITITPTTTTTTNSMISDLSSLIISNVSPRKYNNNTSNTNSDSSSSCNMSPLSILDDSFEPIVTGGRIGILSYDDDNDIDNENNNHHSICSGSSSHMSLNRNKKNSLKNRDKNDDNNNSDASSSHSMSYEIPSPIKEFKSPSTKQNRHTNTNRNTPINDSNHNHNPLLKDIYDYIKNMSIPNSPEHRIETSTPLKEDLYLLKKDILKLISNENENMISEEQIEMIAGLVSEAKKIEEDLDLKEFNSEEYDNKNYLNFYKNESLFNSYDNKNNHNNTNIDKYIEFVSPNSSTNEATSRSTSTSILSHSSHSFLSDDINFNSPIIIPGGRSGIIPDFNDEDDEEEQGGGIGEYEDHKKYNHDHNNNRNSSSYNSRVLTERGDERQYDDKEDKMNRIDRMKDSHSNTNTPNNKNNIDNNNNDDDEFVLLRKRLENNISKINQITNKYSAPNSPNNYYHHRNNKDEKDGSTSTNTSSPLAMKQQSKKQQHQQHQHSKKSIVKDIFSSSIIIPNSIENSNTTGDVRDRNNNKGKNNRNNGDINTCGERDSDVSPSQRRKDTPLKSKLLFSRPRILPPPVPLISSSIFDSPERVLQDL